MAKPMLQRVAVVLLALLAGGWALGRFAASAPAAAAEEAAEEADAPESEAPEADAAAKPAAAEPGRIGVDDLLEVSILGQAGEPLMVVARVNSDGQVGLPYLGAFKVSGLAAADAEAEVIKQYKHQRIIEHGAVVVRRLELGKAAAVKSGPAAKGDLLEVTVNDLAGPGVAIPVLARVQEDGTVGLPYVKVKVEGLSDIRAAEAVAKQYKDDGIIEHAAVTVLKVESAEKPTVKVGKIAEGDLLLVSAFDLDGPGRLSELPVRVGKDGTGHLPHVGAVKLAGLTESAAGEFVRRTYREKGMVEHMGVWVLRAESGEKPGAARAGPVEKGDLLRVTVADLNGPGRPAVLLKRVDAAGRFSLPYIHPVELAGKTEGAAADAVAAAYRKANLIEMPGVTLWKVESAPAAAEGGAAADLPDVPTKPVPAVLRALLEPERPPREPPAPAR